MYDDAGTMKPRSRINMTTIAIDGLGLPVDGDYYRIGWCAMPRIHK